MRIHGLCTSCFRQSGVSNASEIDDINANYDVVDAMSDSQQSG